LAVDKKQSSTDNSDNIGRQTSRQLKQQVAENAKQDRRNASVLLDIKNDNTSRI
jgi:hypothetical protein